MKNKMKKHLSRILIILLAIWAIIGNTSCKNEYKDMVPGEVRLKENDYRNDDKLQDIEYTTDVDTATMSAMEIRAIWHAAIIRAENGFENKNETEANLYESPIQAEDTFFAHLQESMNFIAEKYPYSYNAIIKELTRAKVSTYVKYVWCAQAEEYVNLKFQATPDIAYAEAPGE